MEHRTGARARSFLKARLIFNDGNSSLDGVIRDFSESGARLQISNSVALPDRFDLYIAKKDETRRVKLKWRTDEEIGVAFEDAAASTSQPLEVMQRMSQLESEVADLRRLLDEMRVELRTASSERSKVAT